MRERVKVKSLISLLFVVVFLLTSASIIRAQEWKKEYEEICSKTSDAMALTVDELRELISRCDKLRRVLEALEDDSTRRVYLKRLQMCRDLYQFCLDQKLIQK